MKAIRFSAPGTVDLVDIPRSPLKADEVRVLVEMCGICGTDLELFSGTMPYIQQGLTGYPLTPGHEWCGRVVAVGNDAPKTLLGRRVVAETVLGCEECAFCRQGLPVLCPHREEIGILGRAGGLAEEVAVPARALHPVGDEVDAQDAALIEPLAVSLNALRRLNVLPADSVLVVGLGTIGALTAAAADTLGALVYAFDPDPDRRMIAERAGCRGFWTNANDLLNAVSGPMTVVIEASGHSGAFDLCLEAAKAGGRIGVLGITPGLERVSTYKIATKCLTVQGFIGSPGTWPQAISLVESGAIVPTRLLPTRISPLAKVPELFALISEKRHKGLKHLVRVKRP